MSGGFTQVGQQPAVVEPTTPLKPVQEVAKPEVAKAEDVPMVAEVENGNGENVKIVKFQARSGKGRMSFEWVSKEYCY